MTDHTKIKTAMLEGEIEYLEKENERLMQQNEILGKMNNELHEYNKETNKRNRSLHEIIDQNDDKSEIYRLNILIENLEDEVERLRNE